LGGGADSDFDNEIDDEEMFLLKDIDESELVGLTELEREALISERADKRQRLLERLEIKKRLQAGSQSTCL
jgi:hypothetical protein